MQDYKKLTIVCRYDEDIQWIKNLKTYYIIYNHGEDWLWPEIHKIDSPNIGREAEAFLRGILENYDQLHLLETVIFLQGHPFDHCANTIDIINNANKDTYMPLTTHCNPFEFANDDDFYINGFYNILIRKIFCPEEKITCPLIYDDHIEESEIVATDLALVSFVCKMMDIPYKGRSYQWGSGAQHIVPVSKIINKPYEWWACLYKLIVIANNPIGTGIRMSGTFENLWPLIFEYDPSKGD
jgi:hypothetical protein